MLNMNEIRKGAVIMFEGEPYLVVSAQFLRKQQRRPVMKTILKHLRTGRTKEHSYQQADKIEEANIERRHAQFLYDTDGDAYAFMDMETFDQTELPEELIGDSAQFLLEGQDVQLVLLDGKAVSVELPIKIDRKVIEAPPGVRGDTSTNVMKDAVVQGGVRVKVPLFINEGDMVKIDTRSGEYLERA
jgi:elongation factor P